MSSRGLFVVVLTSVLSACACGGRSSAPAAKVVTPSRVTAAAPSPARAPVVAAPKRPVTHTYFGADVLDDYEWLEDGKSAEVMAFTEAQNALSRRFLDLPERKRVHDRVSAIAHAATPDWTSLRRAGRSLFALQHTPPKPQPALVVMGPEADRASAKVVLDPEILDPSGKTTIDFYVPSPDGALVAISISKNGTESGDVHLYEVATGKERTSDTIARVNGGTAGGSLAWNADGSGFYYTRYPHASERPQADIDFYQQVYFHRLGTPESADVYSIGKDFPRIAETELERSDDGKSVLALVSNGDGGEIEHHVFQDGKWTRLSRFEDELGAASFGADGRVYAVSRKKAPRGKVVAFVPPFTTPPIDVVPEGDAVIAEVVATSKSLYLIEVVGGPSRVRRIPLDPKAEPLAREPKHAAPAKPAKKGAPPPPKKPAPPETIPAGARGASSAFLPLPSVPNVSGVLRSGEDLLLRVESHVLAPVWFRYVSAEHRLVPTSLAKTAGYDTSDIEVVRETCVSADGTKVPMSILRKRGMKLDGTAPVYLTGYGGFAVSIKPRLRTAFRVWLDAGGVVAEANLRGGSELGEEWHRAGMLTNKQHVFDDFAACAKSVVDLGYTRPEKLAISGRSNGGLLIGATVVQHPELFRAAVAAVGIYDMLRSELSSNGSFNVTEFGSVKDEAQARALRAYSPFHNVKDGTPYPAVLFMTGANDPRVDPYQSRKMVARLQAATSSERPILLRASSDTGHGMGTPLAAEIEELTDMLTFLFHELGVTFPEASTIQGG